MKGRQIYIIIIISLITLVLVNLPFFLDAGYKNNAFAFLGRRVINSQDTYTYLAFIEQAKQGQWLFRNLYDAKDTAPHLIRPSYVVIGKVAHIMGISSLSAYHGSRMLLSMLFFFMLYKCLVVWLREQHMRQVLCYALVCLSGGLGFMMHGLIPESTDMWIPESLTFLSLGEAPHFILAQLMILTGIWGILQYSERKKIGYLIAAAGSFLILSVEHPFTVFSCIGALFLYACLEKTVSLKATIFVVFFACLGVGYHGYEVIQGSLGSWYQQNILLSPGLTAYISGFGLLIPLFLTGFGRLWEGKDKKNKFFLYWITVICMLCYMPVPFQRRFIEGIHIPLCLGATVGLFVLGEWLSNRWRLRGLSIGVFLMIGALLFGSAVYTVIADIVTISSEQPNSYYYHILKEEKEAMDWLKIHTTPNNVILANWFYGNIIPGITGRAVVVGHKIQTPKFDKKVEEINTFLVGKNALDQIAFLRNYNVSYIYLGKDDSMTSFGFRPNTVSFLTPVYANGGVAIYRVTY